MLQITETNTTKETHNRKDIQGLRAVAILTVLFAHANFAGFSGGFVGVDVFFVISGFLITGILIKEYNRNGRISISDFYARRVRRIIPAATIVILFTIVASTIILGREGSTSTYWDAFWSSIFMSNWYMAFVGTDYFSLGSIPSPLQHYWSLAVEEQFYFIWPALIILATIMVGRKRNIKSVLMLMLAIIITASFAWSIYETNTEANIAYFSTLTRAWELALGALLAVIAVKIKFNNILRAVMLYTGLALILIAVFLFTESTLFPSYNALLPTLGAVLVLASGTNTDAPYNHVLTNRFMVWVGGISYALYLWHWPLLILWEMKNGEPPTLPIAITLIIVATLLAWVSTRFVEDPIRLNTWWKNKKTLTNITGIMIVIATAVTSFLMIPQANQKNINLNVITGEQIKEAIIQATKPNSQAYIPDVTMPSLANISSDKSIAYDDGCHMEHDNQLVLQTCIYGDKTSKTHVVIMGDSHASMWIPALNIWGIKNNVKVTLFAKSECPAADFTPYSQIVKREYNECSLWRETVIQTINDIKPTAVIITGANSIHAVDDNGIEITDVKIMNEIWVEGYLSTIAQLKENNNNIIFLSDIPKLGKDSADCIIANQEDAEVCSTTLNEETKRALEREKTIINETNINYIETVPFFCYENTCPAIIDNRIVFMDGTHMTKTYSELLAGPIGEKLNKYVRK